MRKRGVTIIAILLMLVVLATVIGAMTLAGSGTLNGQFVSTQGEEARRAAEAGAQAALATIQAGGPLPGWIYTPTSVAPIPWQKMAHVDSEFQVLHIDHSTAPANSSWLNLGNPAQGILPTVTLNAPTAPAGAAAEVPAANDLHYLFSTGRTRSGHFRSVGLLYTATPPVRVLSLQIF